MRIKKVKIKGDGRIAIEYEKESTGNPELVDELSINSPDRPMNSFYTAMEGLRPHVCVICELPEDYAKTMTISGLSLTYAHDVMGVVITAKKDLKHSPSPLVINTPHKPIEPYSKGGDDSNCLTSDQCVAIDQVIQEALRYIRGERLQAMLPLDQPPAQDFISMEMISNAIDAIREIRRASTSALQRKLEIDYSTAAKLMDALEERGVVGPPNGTEPREILMELEV